ncbi:MULTISPECIES: DUF927 domain-containing protein [Psychrobacter]|uniref:DUF927 domain-containing protein n=1 Tax=Psychrobacter TaxID=497 RepID=UPI00146C1EE5|nr:MULTISPECIES: DUF927 domain-containing protein [Psychrobacter]
MINSNKEKAHVRGVSFLDELKTFKPATEQELLCDALLLKADGLLDNQLLAITANLTITDGADAGKIEQTQGSIAIALTDKHGETVGAVFYQPNGKQPPIIIDDTGYGAIVLGDNDPSYEVIAFNGLDDGLQAYYKCMATNEKVTIIVSATNKPHHVKAMIQHWGRTRRVIVPMTLDDKTTLNRLSGVEAQALVTIADFATMLGTDDNPKRLDEVKAEAEIINLADTAYYPEWRKDKAVMLNEPMIYDDGRFELYHDGLYLAKYNLDDPANITFKYKMRICSALEVIAQTRDDTSNSWGRLLKWHDADNKLHQWAMPLALLQGDAREYRRELANQGLLITTNQKHRVYLDAYIQDYPAYQRALCVSKLGWYGERFVLPDTTLGGDDNELIVYQSSHAINSTLAQKGSLEQWRDNLCQPLADQSRFVFSIACAFAGQLLEPLGYDGGGFHLLGSSSMGKSLSLKVAASVWGNPDNYVKTWRQTDNALESTACQHNDSFLALDEISECDPKIIGKCVYMIGNGQGKGRSTVSGHNRKTSTWRLIFLSNGEEALDKFMAQVGQKTNAGIEVRIAHIDADAGKGLKTFDSLVLAATGEAQADKIRTLSSSYFGSAGMAWLEYLTQDKAAVTATAKTFIDEFMSRYPDIKAQAYRVGTRFAIVAAAGEMATKAGITGWQAGQATKAVATCFDNWLDNYGHDGEHEQQQIIEHIKSFIEQHGSSRFQPCHSSVYQDFMVKIHNRAGYHNLETGEYYFLTSVFDKEVCSPFSKKKVLQVLEEAGLLVIQQNDRKTYKVPPRLIRERPSVYVVKPDIFNCDLNNMNGTDGTSHIAQELAPSQNEIMR